MSDQQRPTIRPYAVRPDKRSSKRVLADMNQAQYFCYSADYARGAGPGKLVLNPLFDYERLLRRLAAIPGVEFLTMDRLIAGGGGDGRIRVTIRHDVDGDIVCAQRMAELEREHRIPTTYYLLHTGPYYGRFSDGAFHRFEEMASCYCAIQDLGHEIGLHTDGLLVYRDHEMDGGQALVEELGWMRGQGLRITGTAAHNHHSVYGAQNFEIFKGRVRNFVMPGGNDVPVVDEDEVFFEGKWAPLHRLDERELGLTYEAHDSYLVPGYLGIMAEIAFGTINQTWNARAGATERGLENGPGDFAKLDDALGRLRPGDAIIFTTHPCYYGARHRPDAGPVLRLDERTLVRNRALGWTTYEPGSLVAVSTEDEGGQRSQSLNFANEHGFADKPLGGAPPDALHVLLFGGANLEARELGVPEQIQSQLERALDTRCSGATWVRSCAFEGMGVTRYAAWYRALARLVPAHVVLLGLSLESLIESHPALWSACAATSEAKSDLHLAWNAAHGDVELVPIGGGSAARRDPAGYRLDVIDEGAEIEGVPLLEYLAAAYRFLAGRIREDGGRPILLVDDGGSPGSDDDRFERTVRFIGETADVEIVDPRAAFATWTGPGRAVDERGRWTAVGHRLAARATAERLDAHRPGAGPSPATGSSRPPITVVDIRSLSYTGTTWINVVLGSHPEALAVGPPERFLELHENDAARLCLVHGNRCTFWPEFCRRYDRSRNFFVQLADFTGRRVIVINNPTAAGFEPELVHGRIRRRRVYVLRDGRAVSASYARKFGMDYLDALANWYAPAIRHFPADETEAPGVFVRYEDMVRRPEATLARLGDVIGIDYTADALRYWEHDHHPISGNQGMYAMIKLHLGLPIADFESRSFYEERYRSGVEREGRPLEDERWREQLTRREIFAFGYLCGAKNARMGYAADVFTEEERRRWEPEVRERIGAPVPTNVGDARPRPRWQRVKRALPAPIIQIARRAKRLLMK